MMDSVYVILLFSFQFRIIVSVFERYISSSTFDQAIEINVLNLFDREHAKLTSGVSLKTKKECILSHHPEQKNL